MDKTELSSDDNSSDSDEVFVVCGVSQDIMYMNMYRYSYTVVLSLYDVRLR